MSECCSACNGVILESQNKVKCAGPCGEVFHSTCAEENEYRKTRGVPKDVNGAGKVSHQLQINQNLTTPTVVTDLLGGVLQSFKQQMINEFQQFTEQFKNKYDVCDVIKHNTDASGVKKELSELRIQNEVLRTQNAALVKQVKVLELKVADDSKMFDELKKLLRNLTKDVDTNSKVVADLKDELKEVRDLNDTLESEHSGLAVQVRGLEDKVNDLEKSLKNFSEKSVPSRVVALQPKKDGENQLETIPKSSVLSSGRDNRVLSMTGSTQKHCDFVVDIMGNKPVTALAGIGPVYGGRLNQCGYYKASQVYEKFLALNKDKGLFESWLYSVCGANSRWANHCYRCLHDWNINFGGRLPQPAKSNQLDPLELVLLGLNY